jgi:hypothetical protein
VHVNSVLCTGITARRPADLRSGKIHHAQLTPQYVATLDAFSRVEGRVVCQHKLCVALVFVCTWAQDERAADLHMAQPYVCDGDAVHDYASSTVSLGHHS